MDNLRVVKPKMKVIQNKKKKKKKPKDIFSNKDIK